MERQERKSVDVAPRLYDQVCCGGDRLQQELDDVRGERRKGGDEAGPARDDDDRRAATAGGVKPFLTVLLEEIWREEPCLSPSRIIIWTYAVTGYEVRGLYWRPGRCPAIKRKRRTMTNKPAIWRVGLPDGRVLEGRSLSEAQARKNARWAAAEASGIRTVRLGMEGIATASEMALPRLRWAKQHGWSSWEAYVKDVMQRRLDYVDSCIYSFRFGGGK